MAPGHCRAFIRMLMILAGALALAGLAGVAAGDVQIRDIGNIGQVGVFPARSCSGGPLRQWRQTETAPCDYFPAAGALST